MNSTIILKRATSLIILLIGYNNMLAQQDTLWYNAKWKLSKKTEASFYRPPVKAEGNFFRIKDYYKSGELQMNAISKYADKDHWEGLVTWYNKDGSIHQEGNYKDHKLNGAYTSYIKEKKILANYKNGQYVNGETNINCRTYYIYLAEINDGFKRVFHNGDLNGLRYEEYLDQDKKKKYTKYYDDNGELLGESKNTPDGSKVGIEILYNYNPFSISNIEYYSKSGTYLGSSIYYNNGTLREKFEQEPGYKTTYYNTNGEELGSLTYRMKNSYLKAENGTKYSFESKYNIKKANETGETWPISITTYKDGLTTKFEEKYKDQSTKALFTYENGYRLLDLFYDEKGKEISRLTYKDYKPFDGIQFERDVKRTYKEGVLLEEIKYYANTKKQFMALKNAIETYYDLNGEVLGTLTLNIDNYNSPENGTRYSQYKGVIERIEEYKDGVRIKLTSIKKDTKGKSFKTIELYDDSGYSKIKETKFYSNGKIKSEINYKKYNPITGIYFNDKGEEIGRYNYKTKEGKRYEFFYNSDQIKEIEEIVNNKLVRNVTYIESYDNQKKTYEYIIIKDIDNSKDAKFYNKYGELIAKASFKNGELDNGTIYNERDKELYHIKEGLKNGKYTKYYYNEKILEEGNFKNDLKEGVFTAYSSSGSKTSTVNFTNNKKEGEAIYYNANGDVLSKMIYKDDLPYSGKKTTHSEYNKSYKEETYTNGNIIQSIDAKKEGKTITNYANKTSKEVTKYNENNQKILSYNLKNEQLEGKVISYNDKEKIIRTAEFEDGKLINGTVRIKGDSYNNKEDYLLLTRTDSSFSVKKYNTGGLEYEATENIEKGMRLQHLNKLNSRINYIYHTDLE